MSKRRKRMKKAYLKHVAHRYDPLSDYALRTRGAKAIDLGSVPPPTIMHGKRGLTMARAEGPTAVKKDNFTDDVDQQHLKGATKSTMIPRVAVKVTHDAMVKFEQSDFYQKIRSYYHILILRRPEYSLTMWFSGNEFVFVKDLNGTKQFRSLIYTTEEAKIRKDLPSMITWVEEVLPRPLNTSG